MFHAFRDLRRRRRSDEWMDRPDADPELVRKSLRFLRRINWLLGYTRSTINHLERFSRSWKPGKRIRILDFATGSADVPRAMLRWADRRGFDLRVVGVDLHATTAQTAVTLNPHARLQIVRADVLELPFADDSFDYATTSLFLHHLDDADVVRVLSGMSRVARRGIIAGDLLRLRRAYAWIKLFTLFANPIVRNDGPASIAQAFTRDEVLALRDRAGVSFAEYFEHFGHRFVLAGEKDDRLKG
jgi:2-polyprenyl-3-methyl-5-hydroxy-6-metoxy-1,4-benzoquinol methylase